MTSAIIFLAVCLLGVLHAAHACQDTVSPSFYINVPDPITGVTEKFTNCTALISRYAILCDNYGYGDDNGPCCLTCQQTDLTCIDNNLLYFTIDGVRKGCSDIAQHYPHWCLSQNTATSCCHSCSQLPVCSDYLDENSKINVYSSANVFIESVTSCDQLVTFYPQFCTKYGVDGERCCQSCKSINPDCFDSLTQNNAITVTHADNTQTVISDCNTLVTSFLYLCEQSAGQNNGVCCTSCSQQDLTCYDDTSVSWSGETCAAYIAGDICRCQTAGQTCCASCDGKDLSVCECRDYLSDSTAITFYTPNNEEFETVNNCARLVDAYRQKCSTYGQSGERCCESCSNVNTVCYDYMSPVSPIIVNHLDGTQTTLDDCDQLITPEFLYLCRGNAGQDGGRCCESCSQQDLACIDDNGKYFGSQSQKCADYVAADPCRCLEISGLAGACCTSCSAQDTSSCACRDYLDDNYAITFSTSDNVVIETVNSCSRLVDAYRQHCSTYGQSGERCCESCSNVNTVCYDYMSPVSTITVNHLDGTKTTLDDCSKVITPEFLYLCRGSAGQDGGRCCESCGQQDLTCIDDNGRYFGSQSEKCADYVAADPCRCLEISGLADTCCTSCGAHDTSYCGCRDKLSPTRTVTISTTTSSGTTQTVVDSCQTIVDSFQHWCAKGPEDLGQDGGLCCDSCAGICVDSRTFKMSVTRRSKSCTDCTCAQILAKGNKLMKKACNNGALEACCETCTALLS